MPPAGESSYSSELRKLPAVDRIVAALQGTAPTPVVTAAARVVLETVRGRIAEGSRAPTFEEVVDQVSARVDTQRVPGLRRVINATGVLVHTNLGRAPLGGEQLAAIAEVAGGYSNLEFDLDGGHRGSRYAHARRSLVALTGAESALVVNNNAAAVLVVLAALCRDKEVIISRGELIEIGGEFRIPDVMAISGAKLVEVGTTNRTHLADFERAITPDTAAILKVHPSNYLMVGFTSSVVGRDLATLARDRGLTFIHDVGSGLIEPAVNAPWSAGEPVVSAALEDGADVVTFSGDKLLGGPQAGIIVGNHDRIDAIERNPLLRALRVDKMTVAALEATVSAYLSGEIRDLPLWDLAMTEEEQLRTRAEGIAEEIRRRVGEDIKVEATATESLPGGGSLPGATIPSWAIAISVSGVDGLQRELRSGTPPVIARINDDRVIVDLRTVFVEQDKLLTQALLGALEA